MQVPKRFWVSIYAMKQTFFWIQCCLFLFKSWQANLLNMHTQGDFCHGHCCFVLGRCLPCLASMCSCCWLAVRNKDAWCCLWWGSVWRSHVSWCHQHCPCGLGVHASHLDPFLISDAAFKCNISAWSAGTLDGITGWFSAMHSNWFTCKEPTLISVPAQRIKPSMCEEGWGLKLYVSCTKQYCGSQFVAGLLLCAAKCQP